MADNITINDADGTDRIVAADELAGAVFVQRVKPVFGGNGVGTDVSATDPLPVVAKKATSVHHVVTAATTNASNIKNSAAVLRAAHGYNHAEYPVKFCFHNTTGTPTAGASVTLAQVVQAGQRMDFPIPGGGFDFSAGLGRTIVKIGGSTDMSDTGATATAANDAVFDVFYD